jgi:hypothetical protein
MFTFLLLVSLAAGLAISWIGRFGTDDHDKGHGRNDT